ncbi:hypothetical protein S40288_04511 [Stachybotrys chartarum IBT 40288]|nr:hypothetical protein S40288_04511 [Stachybotrys chartarum IBT 40288]
MWGSLLTVVILLLLARYLLPAILSIPFHNKHEDKALNSDDLAEIEGETWRQMSIFEHIELGLKKSPDGPAIVCLFQPQSDLEDLVVSCQSPEPDTQDALEPIDAIIRRSDSRNTSLEISDSNGVNKTKSPESLWQHPASHSQPNGIHDSRDPYGVNGFTPKKVDKETYGRSSLRQETHWLQSTSIQHTHAITPVFTLTYRQLHRAALRLAAGLVANGAQPESTILILIPNGGEYAILLWACVLLRITYVSVDPASLDIRGFTMLKHMLQSLRPQLVVTPDPISGRAIEVAIQELQLAQPLLLCLSRPSAPSDWKSLVMIANDAVKYKGKEATIVSSARKDRQNRIHYILYTSGTSGLPKGCPLTVSGMSHDLHSQAWLVDSESGTAKFALQQAHNSRAICPLQTLQTWRAGGCVLMTNRGLDVEDIADAVCGTHPYRATFVVLSPPMVHELAVELSTRRQTAHNGRLDTTSVKRVQLGGDTVTKDLLAKCAAVFPQSQICVNHGMSEGPGMFFWPFLDKPLHEISLFGEICPIGVPAPGCSIRIWDDGANRTASRGQLGELHIARGSIIESYWAGRSSESFYTDNNNRWFNTGDMAIIDQDGLVFILGRKKDMIKRAGIGIMPAAIESSIEALIGTQTIVVPVSHPVLGAEPFAVLGSYNGKGKEEIQGHIRTALGKDYALGGVASLEEIGLSHFPVNPTHKIMKSKVQTAVER